MIQSQMEVVVRAMELEDLANVLEIDRLSFPVPWPERSYRYELTENPASNLLVAESNGSIRRVVGFIGSWLIADEVHISTLAVHPSFRGLGLGKTLLEAILDQTARRGAEIATLEVRVSNTTAIDLYRKTGFEVVGRRPGYYRDNGEDALLMTLSGLRGQGWGADGGDE
ncbi:MAG TPA: ribosomal protein S18-alanine N-acetyltransferase [Anaerolineales bacterium]|nr:ribosomal protein S18-alanine N-acetyltransferase [Anaerolineales bacterium]